MTKAEKEMAILKRLNNLQSLDNVGCHGYIYMNYLIDIIAEVAFGCDNHHDFYGDTIYPDSIEDYKKLMEKIARVIEGMADKKIIRISKSKKMFKIVEGEE